MSGLMLHRAKMMRTMPSIIIIGNMKYMIFLKHNIKSWKPGNGKKSDLGGNG